MKIDLNQISNDEILIKIEGVWDMEGATDFIYTCTAPIKTNRKIIIDLEKVEYICVSGLRQLLYTQYIASINHNDFKIINVDDRTYRKLLELNYIERMDIKVRQAA